MAGLFEKFTSGLSSPGQHAAVVTPNDSADLATFARALIIGVAGNVKVDTVGGETVMIPAVAGVLPVRVRRVYSTDTTASGIVAIW